MLAPATLLALVAGALAGLVQALGLRRAARAGGAALGLGLLLRLALVGGVLLAAALAGHLLPAALGWGLAFAAAALTLARRWR
ncbi:MAG: hypothetical protein H6711_05215 [Myxococcales bacterium]|nr:hypothetical protein [Myxococcales bacterium]